MTTDASAELTLDSAGLLSFLADKAIRPMSVEAILRELELPEDAEPRLQTLIAELVGAGRLIETRNRRYGCPERLNLVVGSLSVHPDGFGFVVPATGDKDLFIAGANLGEAMHGDRVVARPEHRRRSGRVEGRVIRILERARSRLVGRIERRGDGGWVVPLDRRFVRDTRVADVGDAQEGQIVTVEITSYASESRASEGKIVEVLGEAGDLRVDIDVVIREYELPHEFAEEVLAAAERVPAVVTEEDVEGRTDFRELPVVTIDGESAQDFDDAVFVELTPNGLYRLHVHIADVAYYVGADSELDAEALRRATSVYFPGRVLPMLPETLSNGICSLKPGVDRLVHSAVIDIDRQGRTVGYEFHDGVIHSAARLTYRQVASALGVAEETDEELQPHQRQLERMRDLAEVLMEYRRDRGSIDFDLPEPELVINLRGETEDIVKSERNVAHRIIEEFMIRANEVVASHLAWEADAAIYRVHEGPDLQKVESFREFISGLGHTLGGGRAPKPGHFMDLVERLEGRPEERVISMLMLRTMKQARYQVGNDGHFGLASSRYTHFTSPIRRYPDLIVHRLLKADNGSEQVAPFDAEQLGGQLESIATHCSTRERVAEEAERKYCGWKKIQFMADKLGEVFEGHITGVRSFGIFVELEPHFVEGLVPVSTLTDDFYRYDEPKHALTGENTGRTLQLGDRVKIQVAKVDLERRRLDFSLEEGPLELPAPPPARRRRSRRGRGSAQRRSARSGRERADERPESGQPAEIAAQQAAEVSAPAETGGVPGEGSSEERKRPARRRRGRRGGRRRSSRGGTPEQAAAESTAPEAGEKPQTEAKPQKAERAKSSRRKPQRRGRPDRGRGTRGNEIKPAASPVGESKPATETKPETPAVNPYLTEIDY